MSRFSDAHICHHIIVTKNKKNMKRIEYIVGVCVCFHSECESTETICIDTFSAFHICMHSENCHIRIFPIQQTKNLNETRRKKKRAKHTKSLMHFNECTVLYTVRTSRWQHSIENFTVKNQISSSISPAGEEKLVQRVYHLGLIELRI